MGNWTIVIEGTGSHHNKDYPKDANKLAEAFVADLGAAGHTVEHATFTHSGRDDLTAGTGEDDGSTTEPEA
jgi:hypothetical protein